MWFIQCDTSNYLVVRHPNTWRRCVHADPTAGWHRGGLTSAARSVRMKSKKHRAWTTVLPCQLIMWVTALSSFLHSFTRMEKEQDLRQPVKVNTKIQRDLSSEKEEKNEAVQLQLDNLKEDIPAKQPQGHIWIRKLKHCIWPALGNDLKDAAGNNKEQYQQQTNYYLHCDNFGGLALEGGLKGQGEHLRVMPYFSVGSSLLWRCDS